MGVVRHRVTLGRSREVRGPDALERGFAGMIIAVAMVIAVGFGVQLIQMTQTLDAVSIVRGAQINAIVYHAEYGRWPAPGDRHIAAGNVHGSYVEHLTLGDGGVITAELTLAPRATLGGGAASGPGSLHGFLSFRPELLGSKEAPSISFLCGYATRDAGAIGSIAANQTSLPRKFLPPYCR